MLDEEHPHPSKDSLPSQNQNHRVQKKKKKKKKKKMSTADELQFFPLSENKIEKGSKYIIC